MKISPKLMSRARRQDVSDPVAYKLTQALDAITGG
jgi:hypothetical protein